ncbi:MAG: cell envelope integrity protein TolA [Myxococcaceae bacterium]
MALLLAALGHIAFVAVLLFLAFVELHIPGGAPRNVPQKPVEMRPLTAQQWQQNRGNNPAEQQKEQPQKQLAQRDKPLEEIKKPDQTPQGQVVETAPGNKQEDPNAKYLAESSNKVKKETRAKETTPFYRNAMPRHTTTVPQNGAGHDDAEKPQVAGNDGIGQDDRPLMEPSQKKATLEVPDVKERQEIALQMKNERGPGVNVENQSESEAVQGNSNRLKIAPGSNDGEAPSNGRVGKEGVANLLPSAAVLDKLSGAAANDHLEDVDEGDGTFLNTKEWKYASFFNRVKQSVGMHWDPSASLRVRDPSGQIFGGRDRYTVLNVTLNEQGRVKDVYVEKSCGLDFLDLEAVKSFERAQPFPNPPPGLVTADSTVKFSFGFFIDMGGGPRLRLFRSAD